MPSVSSPQNSCIKLNDCHYYILSFIVAIRISTVNQSCFSLLFEWRILRARARKSNQVDGGRQGKFKHVAQHHFLTANATYELCHVALVNSSYQNVRAKRGFSQPFVFTSSFSCVGGPHILFCPPENPFENRTAV